MEDFEEIANGWNPLTILAKGSISGVPLGSEYVSEYSLWMSLISVRSYLNVGDISLRWDNFSPCFARLSQLDIILMWYTNQRITSYGLGVNILTSCVYCTSYELRFIFIARVTSYFCVRVTRYCLLHKLRVTSYCLFHEVRVTIIAQVTSYCLFPGLRVTVYCTSYQLLFAYELRVSVFCTSHELYFNYDFR